MNRLTFVPAAVLHAVLCAASAASPLEDKLQGLRARDPSREQLAELYQLRTNAPDAEVHATIVKTCAAGLCYLGQAETYAKLRSSIEKVEALEAGMSVPCGRCAAQLPPPAVGGPASAGDAVAPGASGQPAGVAVPGKTVSTCAACKGTRRCQVATCRGGSRIIYGFNGSATVGVCPGCNGTARCLKCGGSGKIQTACASCQGRGMVFSKSAALERYRAGIEEALGLYEASRDEALAKEEGRRREEERAAHERKMLEVEVVARKEAILVEAQTAGAERARQEAALKAREIERRQAEEVNAKLAERDKKYLKCVVVIEGDRGVGTGFLCQFNGKKVVLSNAHVLCGNRRLRMRSLNGDDLPYKRVNVCKDRDVVAYELADTKGLDFLPLYASVTNMSFQENVVVFGNSGGGGVVTTLRGQMLGIGPDSIEVDAKFVQGNSGSPIVAYPYDAVVGMATYATQNPVVDWTNRSTRFTEVRRFGMRLDNVGWDRFFVLDGKAYDQALDVFDAMYAFANDEVLKAKWLGSYYRATPEARGKAERLLERYRETPEWMRRYADDAALAAYVCTLVLK